jgi:hypothetical protein
MSIAFTLVAFQPRGTLNGKEDERMQEGDRLFLSKFAIDPEMESEFDTYGMSDLDFGPDIDPDVDDIKIDWIDEDSWGDY